MSSAATIVYWQLNARATPAQFVASLGGVELNWDADGANTWPALKGEAPFGQLPFVRDGESRIAQSFAIVRYFGRKGNTQGDDLASYGISEQITEEARDLFEGLAKSKYGADPVAEYTKYFETFLPAQFAFLENLLSKGSFFAGDKPLQGDAALYGVLYLASRVHQEHFNTALATAPKLKAWKESFEAIPSIAATKTQLDAIGVYFSWPQ